MRGLGEDSKQQKRMVGCFVARGALHVGPRGLVRDDRGEQACPTPCSSGGGVLRVRCGRGDDGLLAVLSEPSSLKDLPLDAEAVLDDANLWMRRTTARKWIEVNNT
jgi:hypothetical protein